MSTRYILSYIEIPPPLAVRSSLNGFEKPSIKNCDPGKVSSIFFSDTLSISRLLPTNLTSDSNLFLIEFILRWPMIILCGFWFLSCLSSQMPLVFLSILGSEGGLSNFPETLRSASSDWLLGERGLSALQAFRISEFDSGNSKRVYLYLLRSDAILSDQDVEHWCCHFQYILNLKFPDVY